MERFLDYFVPERYDIDLKIDKENRQLDGHVRVLGKVLSTGAKLHAVGLKLVQVLIDGKPAKYEYVDGVIAMDAGDFVGNEAVIEVRYSLEINEDMQGAYISKYKHDGKEEVMVATQFESHYARECFPCVDEPAAKAVFGLHVESADADDTVVMNMPEGEDSPRMSTYLLAFVVGKFVKLEAKSEKGVAVTTYAGLNQPVSALKFASDFAVRCVDFYSDLFDTPYPLSKLDQVAVPDFEAGAMENWGLMTFREQALLCDEGSALDQRLYVATVVAHEISHMWFGDLVTMKWWDDLWLNESFASLMETYAVDKLMPELRPWDDFYMGTVVPALRRDCLAGVQPVKVDVANVEDIANLFDGAIVYAKGARLMLMLMRLMGEESFFKGLKDYFAKHAYENTVADDLWESLTPYADFDVKEFMTPWLVQPGYPVLTDGEQKRFLIAGEEKNYTYPVPVVMDDLSGHYILNLSDAEFAAVLAEFDGKNKEQKLRLLLDRGLLAKTPLVKSVSLLPLTQKFGDEKDYVIWDAVSVMVADLKTFMGQGSETETRYKKFVGDLTENSYRRLGAKATSGEPDDEVRLRPIIMGLKCYAEDEAFAADVIRAYENESLATIDANVRSVVLTVFLRADESRGKEYLEEYLKTTDPELKADLLAALTATRNIETAAGYLERLKNGTIKAQDRLFFFVRLARNQVTRTLTLDWAYANWDWLAKSEGDKTISEYPRLMASLIRTEGEAEKYRNFFVPKENEAILRRNIAIGLTEIESRLALIAADGLEIRQYLADL
ncbi:MAG: M1 family metallopeptidase [Candidatus Saccharimonadales bacterium]